MPTIDNSLLLVTYVPIRQGPNGAQIDDQTAAGIAQWCKHFSHVTFCGIADDGAAGGSSSSWVDVPNSTLADKCEIIVFPRAYSPRAALLEYRRVRSKLRALIAKHAHLHFTIAGLVGDWPGEAAIEARRQRRHYSAGVDRVEAPVVRNRLQNSRLTRRIIGNIQLPLMEHRTRTILKRSSVTLLQGHDVFEHYSKWATRPHVTYDTHTSEDDQITAQSLADKSRRVRNGEPLRIAYVGRAVEMKGPSDWLTAISDLFALSVPMRATWIGDGPEHARMKHFVESNGLHEVVSLPGFESDRAAVVKALQESDVFLFCHKTPESPRSLIEALVAGCALVGYGTAYSRGLVESHGGGIFVSQDDIGGLVSTIQSLHARRHETEALIASAAASGRFFSEEAVYLHRASLIKQV